jgi:acyl-CoA reductase-like NAD-dependent aldehyde dehydrogenase
MNGACANFRLGATSTVPFWIDGKEIKSSTTFEVISPLNHEKLYSCSSAEDDHVQAAVSAARRALPSWAATGPKQRRNICMKAAELLLARRDELFKISHSETGEPEAMFGFEHQMAVDGCLSVGGLIETALVSRCPIPDDGGAAALVLKEPYGVVLAIAPWNAPHALGLRACLQPLAYVIPFLSNKCAPTKL